MQDKNLKLEKYGIQLPAALHSQIKGQAAHRSMKLNDAFIEACTLWLQKLGETPASIPPPTQAELQTNRRPGESDLWVETLRDILASEHPTAVPAIQRNLMAFFELVQSAKGNEIDDIRARFATAFKANRKAARELRGDGKRPSESERTPPGRGRKIGA